MTGDDVKFISMTRREPGLQLTLCSDVYLEKQYKYTLAFEPGAYIQMYFK